MERVEKPWGYELIWARTVRYCSKILHINEGHALSRQYHVVKEESLMVLQGEMELQMGEGDDMDCFRMGNGDTIDIPPGTVHRLIAITECDIMEVSTPELNDLVRLEDYYGREGTTAP